MMRKMKKISLMACSLLASAALVSGVCAMPAAQSVSAETPTASFVSVDTETKSAWETAGYGTDGYLILGSNASKDKVGYSNMYTEYGNDGKTELTWYRHGNSEFYYEEYGNGVDDTAPIGKWAWLGQTWSYFNTTGTYSGRNSYLYAPSTTTEYGWRLHNTNASPNRDTGFSFELRDVGSINASVYVTDAQSEWNKVDYTANPITVSLYKTNSLFVTTANDSNKAENVTRLVDEYYGEAVAETTVTTNNVYVTFALNEPGVYTIVAYYKNSDKTVNSTIIPSTMGLFFDKDEGSSAPTPDEKVQVDAETKSAWETAGYGTNGYLVLGGKKAYSNLYTEPDGNNGKTEITLYHAGDKSVYYDSANTISTDSTAPISKLVVNDGSNASWSDATNYTVDGGHWANQPDLYMPGTETKYPVRTTNGNTDPYHDRGLGFTLRETGKIYVTVYVLDWSKKVSADFPITVGLFSGFKNTTFYGYGANKATTLEEHYGTPIVKTTVTSQGAYVTFEIEEAGDYQIVAYYGKQDKDVAPVTPMPTGLFFDKEMCAEVTSTSLSLEGDIGVNYYVGAHGQDLTDAILQVEYPNGTFDQVSAVSKNADGTYKFQVKVAAKDYAAKMQACLFTEDGTTLSRVFEYSAADYVASVLKAGASVYGEDLVALVTALDDYGKAAANLFYAQENTFTADLSSVTLDTLGDYQFALVGDLPSGVALTDFSLSLQSTTSLKIYFTAASLSGVVCKVDGVAVTPVKTGANEYCIEIANINAKDLDTNFVVSIGDCTLTLNTLSYAYRALEYSSDANLKVAMQALYLYNQAANQYFAKEA